jgi:hypothetical protein
MHTTLLSRALFSALALLTVGSRPLLADQVAKITLELKTDAGKAPEAGFLDTQSQVLRKNEILYPVIEQLGLVEKLGKPRAEVARLISDNLKVKVSRNTSLVELIVTQPDQNLASDIVTAIVKEYKERRISDLKNNIEVQLREMKDELDGQKARVQGLFNRATALRQKFNLLDPDPESINVIVTSPALNGLEKSVAEQATRVARLSARSQLLAKLKPEEFLDAVGPLKIEDPVIIQVLPQLAMIRAEEAGLRAGGTPEKDPRIATLRAKMDIYIQSLQQRRESILHGYETALKVEREMLATFKLQLEQALPEKDSIQKYVEAKSEYLLARSLMQVIEQRHAAARFDSSLAVEPVKIWELPERAAK